MVSTYRLRVDLQLFSQEKTEKATPKKMQEARKKGQVPRSPDLPGSILLLAVFMGFSMFGGYFKDRIITLFGNIFENWLLLEITSANVRTLLLDIVFAMFMILWPIFAIAVIVDIVGNVIQFGFLMTGEPFKMKLSKLSPINGFKQMFSMKTVAQFFKSILKLTIVGIFVYITLKNEWPHLVLLSNLPVEGMFSYVGGVTLKLGLQIGAVLIVLSFADYMYMRYEHNKSLRMSKQDIKDEFKKTEGDPIIKGRIREKQRRMALQRMMQEIPKADVVITNPTHFAIALKYDASKMDAPTVIAKGMDHVALRIKEIAKENGVITMENRPLARALYERAEIGHTIPADLFQAVAEILAHVYKMKGRAKSKSS